MPVMKASATVSPVASSKGGIHPSVLAKCASPLPLVVNNQAVHIVGSPSGATGYTSDATGPDDVMTAFRPKMCRYQSRAEAR
jgi:hypothetical protein